MVEQEENVSQRVLRGSDNRQRRARRGAAYLKPTCSFIDFKF